MRKMTIDDILDMQSEVIAETQNYLPGLLDMYRSGVDVLLILLYEHQVPDDVETQPGLTLWFIYYQTRIACFTFTAVLELLSRGFYLEAQILVRSLLELLGKLRFCMAHPERAKDIQMDPQSTSWKTIFGVFPGLYPFYKNLAAIAHIGVQAGIFKFQFRSPTDVEADQGVVYNERRVTWVGNWALVILLGYIKMLLKSGCVDEKALSAAESLQVAQVQDRIATAIAAHVRLKGGENDWHRAVRGIWDS